MLAVFGAMEEEITEFRRAMAVEATDIHGGCQVYRGNYRGHSLLLVKHGVGKRRALNACRDVLDHYPVTAIVSLGFAGALKPGCRTGDMFLYSSIGCAEEPLVDRQLTDARLLGLANSCNLKNMTCGTGVTSLHLVSTPTDKKTLRELSTADMVDMESFWIARLAVENGIPFIVARAVSDAERDTVPNLPSYEWHRAIRYFIWHPFQGWNLYQGMKRARRSLTVFAGHMVEVAG
jgi:adenosylhomocysteine nucleosidase